MLLIPNSSNSGDAFQTGVRPPLQISRSLERPSLVFSTSGLQEEARPRFFFHTRGRAFLPTFGSERTPLFFRPPSRFHFSFLCECLSQSLPLLRGVFFNCRTFSSPRNTLSKQSSSSPSLPLNALYVSDDFFLIVWDGI